MGVYDRQIATARRLIAAKGQLVQWGFAAAAVGGDAWKPQPDVPEDPSPVSIAFFSPKDLQRGNGEFLAALRGTEVPTSNEIGLMAGDVDFDPSADDFIIRDGKHIGIESIDRLAPNGQPILYFVNFKT